MLIAFDRDDTVETGGGPVPISLIKDLQRFGHNVWAIGNQELCFEAGIPGVKDLIEYLELDLSVKEERDFYCGDIERRGRLLLLRRTVKPIEDCIVVDNHDLSDMMGWVWFSPESFVEFGKSSPLFREGSLLTGWVSRLVNQSGDLWIARGISGDADCRKSERRYLNCPNCGCWLNWRERLLNSLKAKG